MEKATYQGFAEVARKIRAGEIEGIHVGDTITTEHAAFGALVWEVIGIRADRAATGEADTLTVQMRNPPLWRSFDNANKAYPWGCNQWARSAARKWMQGELLDGFAPEDRAAIMAVVKQTHNTATEEMEETTDSLFLLSASEVGFEPDGDWIYDEGTVYELYAKGGKRQRQKRDTDGDECYWWLRSPYPSVAYYVRYIIYPSGALNYDYAYSGHGLAAACTIG